MSGKKGMRWGVRGIVSPTNLQELRNLIDAKNVILDLKKHISGEKIMPEPSQVTAALGVLHKVMPNLVASEVDVNAHVGLTIDAEIVRRKLFAVVAATGQDPSLGVSDGAGDSGDRPRLELLGKTGTDSSG